jgi:hypothetical protein
MCAEDPGYQRRVRPVLCHGCQRVGVSLHLHELRVDVEWPVHSAEQFAIHIPPDHREPGRRGTASTWPPRSGAELGDMAQIQIHPTQAAGSKVLITEGCGATGPSSSTARGGGS